MGEIPQIFMIDGIDRLGKTSLIKRIQAEFGYHVVIHFDKPQVLETYLTSAHEIKEADAQDLDPAYAAIQHLSAENIARFMYQDSCNRSMFDLMSSGASIIFDRTHLGECVYAPLYRGYSGDYVMQMEREFVENNTGRTTRNVRQILLTTSNFEILQDDGLSFNFANKEKEQDLFIQAFKAGVLPNKVMVDVHNGSGGYKSFEQVFMEAVYSPSK